ncbi:MAG: hypothetical protein IKI34_06440 [Eubacterium sp.]|nr:hypothetical protein [Eubacterium sp.]
MKHMPKNSMCIFLCFLLAISMSACSAGTELSEQNINKTVLIVEKALKDFDEEDLKRYVESETLSKILSVSGGKKQFKELGEAIFENLSVEITSIDLAKSSVTVSVLNKDLAQGASDFAEDLKASYSNFQLLGKLQDDDFLNSKVSFLKEEISKAEMQNSSTTITLSVKKSKKNLVLVFDENAENAVSGGALGAIMKAFSASL